MTVTKQEVFDTVVNGIIAQGGPSIVTPEISIRVCRYRSDNGRKCAAGILIKDEHYSPDLEGWTAAYSPVIKALTLSGLHQGSIPLVRDLQNSHDNVSNLTMDDEIFIREFLRRAHAVAEYHGLTFSFEVPVDPLEPPLQG